MNKPYIRLADTIGNVTAWIVDGKWVRDHLDIDFTDVGQHYRFDFIPVNEIWVGHEAHPGETNFFIEHGLVERRLMAAGSSYDEALEEADRVEEQERVRSREDYSLTAGQSAANFADYHKELLATVTLGVDAARGTGVKVWLVDGARVRNELDIDFTEGGHGYVYTFIPQDEVWIDDDIDPDERKFIILHELHERNLMSLGLPYGKAHAEANQVEAVARQKESGGIRKAIGGLR